MNAWDAEAAGSSNWERPDTAAGGSAAGSGYPETKDDGAAAEEPVSNTNNWQGSGNGPAARVVVPASEQAVTQGPVSETSGIVITSGAGGRVANARGMRGGSGAGAYSTGASNTSAPNGRRHTMAYEIARMERSGKTVPPPVAQKAKRVWELSRPRYVQTADSGLGPGRRVRVPPGKEDRDAVPYAVWGTSWAQMGDFGLDVGMYFVTVAQLLGAVLVYAALCIVAIIHFSSEEYSGAQEGVRADLRGSAVCTSILSVLAYEAGFDSISAVDRNDCPLDAKQGYADMAGVLLLFLVLLVLGKAQDKAAEYTDTQLHSARPYTVKVSSPDRLADDPDRWRRLFAQFGHVSYITVARGNGALLRALASRRTAGRMVESITANVSEVIDAYKAVESKQRPKRGPGGWWKCFLQPLGFFRDMSYWKQQLWEAHNRVDCEVMQGMHEQGLPVVKVFVTFESDMSRARCLSHMSRGILDTPEEQHMYTNPDGFKESLHVMPASPASEVLYENLHVSHLQRAAIQVLTFALTAAIVLFGYVIATRLDAIGVVPVALLITALDAVLPTLVRLVCSLERHHNSVTHDLSFMNKLTLARWVNIAGIPFVLNDRMGTLTSDNLELVATVLWLNVFVPPAIRLLDIRGRWEKGVIAPKEVVQSAMDSHFRGSPFSLAERYTDTTKTLFACLIYTPVLPLAMWLCFASLALSYWVDKFLFMRVWQTPQPAGNSGRVAKLARRHLALAVLAHCVLALHYYSGWPFDQICRFQGGWVRCSQEGTGLVEAETQDWMTGPQKTLVDVFSALNVAWLVILLVFYYLQGILQGISVVVKGAPRKLRSRQHMPFSQLTSRYQHEVDSYVPQICRADQSLPLLACDLDLLEPETIPWKVDGQKGDSFEDHCLSSARDLPRISRYQRARLFSLCVHYPPPAPFEGIGNGRSSKTDMDWFRRPPPGLQETKIQEIVEAGHVEEAAASVPLGDLPGLVDPELVERHPQSQAPLQSNGELSGVPSSFVSREGEREPMMPSGAQSSLVSTAILRASSAEAGEGSSGTRKTVAGQESGANGDLSLAEGPAALERDGSDGAGTTSARSFSLRSGLSGRSGRSTRARSQNPRIADGEETSEICPGEGADEYTVRRSAAPRGGDPGAVSAAASGEDDGDVLRPLGNPSAPDAVTPGAARDVVGERAGVDDIPSELNSSRILAAEDGELSYYEESHQHYDGDGNVAEDMHDLPTPLLAPQANAGDDGSGRVGSGALELAGGSAAGSAAAVPSPETTSDSEGWVDQYTNSSLGGSREDLAGVNQAPSVSSLQAEQWRKARLTPAV